MPLGSICCFLFQFSDFPAVAPVLEAWFLNAFTSCTFLHLCDATLVLFYSIQLAISHRLCNFGHNYLFKVALFQGWYASDTLVLVINALMATSHHLNRGIFCDGE